MVSHDVEESKHAEEEEQPDARNDGVAAQAAEALAEGLRRSGALSSLAAMVRWGSYDARLALSTLANLSRIGLADALASEPSVRNALVSGLVASRTDSALASFALPAVHNLTVHPLMLRTLCASERLVTAILVKHASASLARSSRSRSRSRAPTADASEDAVVVSASAAKVLARMRMAKAQQRSNIAAALREDAPVSRSRPLLMAWLRPRHRRRVSTLERGATSIDGAKGGSSMRTTPRTVVTI